VIDLSQHHYFRENFTSIQTKKQVSPLLWDGGKSVCGGSVDETSKVTRELYWLAMCCEQNLLYSFVGKYNVWIDIWNFTTSFSLFSFKVQCHIQHGVQLVCLSWKLKNTDVDICTTEGVLMGAPSDVRLHTWHPSLPRRPVGWPAGVFVMHEWVPLARQMAMAGWSTRTLPLGSRWVGRVWLTDVCGDEVEANYMQKHSVCRLLVRTWIMLGECMDYFVNTEIALYLSQGIITGMIKTYRDVSVDSAMLMTSTLSSRSSYM